MSQFKQTWLLAGAVLALTGAPARAADNAMKVCGAKYQAAKSAHTLPAGQTWAQFLAQCRGGMTKTTATVATHPAAAPKPAASPGIFSRMMGKLSGSAPAAAPAARHARASSGGGAAAMHERERQCGAQWKAAKAAGKVPAGQSWPQYWGQCNTRLKG